MPTKYLDLDAVTSDVDFTIKINGKDHSLIEPTVEMFVQNMKELESLSITATPREEMEMTIKMILRSFPTLKEKDLRGMRLSQLNKIWEFARQASGQEIEKAGEESVAESGENPPKAS